VLNVIAFESFNRNSAVISRRLTGNDVRSDPISYQMTMTGHSIADGGTKHNGPLVSLNGNFGKVDYREDALQVTTQTIQINRTIVSTRRRIRNGNL